MHIPSSDQNDLIVSRAGGSAPCGSCAATMLADARFCSQCGAPRRFAEANGVRVAAEPERRQLTVLFCDMVGSTRLSEQVDAEMFRELLLEYQTAVGAVIDRYEGHVAQYLGDGILAYFGYPSAREDDAERAVRAGVEIQAALERHNQAQPQYPFLARVGVHTGPVVVSQIGSAGKERMLALGSTSNLAARMQAIADPGKVVISSSTMHLVPGMFITRDLGRPTLRGVDKPLRAYGVMQASGVRSRLETSAQLTPFVGREEEFGQLCDRWALVRQGRGQVVVIRADPGQGKSRLVLMLREHVAAHPHTWLESRASPMTRNSTLDPVMELLRRGLAIKESDSDEIKLHRLERGLTRAGFDVAESVPLLAPILGFKLPARYPPSALGAELRQRRVVETLCGWIVLLARQQPLLMIFEDLHWADPSTLELIAELIERGVPAAPLYIVLTTRPEFKEPWLEKSSVTTILPGELGNRQVIEMLDSLTGSRRLPAEVVETILRRSGGVPLFVEELTKALLESGQFVEAEGQLTMAGPMADLHVPATLQDSLMERLDRLNDAKAVAQLCAVIGREIPFALLQAVNAGDEEKLRSSLLQLCESGLLFKRGELPDATYLFKHALVQDTAYGSLLKSARIKLHGQIAAVIEARFPERVAASPELLAVHFEQAGEIAAALKHYKRACDSAAARTANNEVIALASHALALLRSLDETPQRHRQELEMLLILGTCRSATLGYGDEESQRIFARARILCSQVDDAALQGRALANLWLAHFNRADLDVALETAEQLIALGRKIRLRLIESFGQTAQAFTLYSLGRIVAAQQSAEAALEGNSLEMSQASLRAIGQDTAIAAMLCLSRSLWLLGFPDRAMSTARAAEERATQMQHPYSIALVRSNTLTWVPLLRGEPDLVIELCLPLVEMTRGHGFTEPHAFALKHLGLAHCLRGDHDIGLRMLREVQASSHGRNTLVAQSNYSGMEAQVCLSAGRLEEAQAALDHAFHMANTHDNRTWDAELYRIKGELALARNPDDVDTAEAWLRRALAVAREQSARAFELRTAISLAGLLKNLNRSAEAVQLLRPIRDSFTEGFETADLALARRVLTALESATQ